LWKTIFEPFKQAGRQSENQPGVGIGLSLVARFTELHGGRAWVNDRPGGGASFHVYLPDGPPDPDALDAPTIIEAPPVPRSKK
jgi:signal transduction histidine kinase